MHNAVHRIVLWLSGEDAAAAELPGNVLTDENDEALTDENDIALLDEG